MFESKRLTNFKPYPVTPHKVWTMKNKEVLKLDWNESTMNIPEKIKNLLVNDIKNSNLNWYPNLKNDELYDEISKFVNVNPANILPTASSDYAHELIARAFIDNKDKVCMVYPTYDNFRSTFESFGADIYKYNLDSDFKLNYEEFENFINKNKIKMVYICNPNNPTGTLHKKTELLKLIHENPKILFVLDEAYIEFGGESLSKESSKLNNLIITRTFSKAFGLASFRIGYIISSINLLESLNKIYNPKNITQLSQNAATYSIKNFKYIQEYIDEVKVSKKILIKKLNEFKFIKSVYGESGNFILVEAESSSKILNFFKEKGIFFRDLSFLTLRNSKTGFFRITVGSSKSVNRIVELFDQYEN